MKYSTKESLGCWGVIILLVLAIITVPYVTWILPSQFEARAYNRVTGENVSTWDAMWIELRVQGTPKTRKDDDSE